MKKVPKETTGKDVIKNCIVFGISYSLNMKFDLTKVGCMFGMLRHTGPKKSQRKISSIHKVFMYNFHAKMSQYSHYTYCLQKESTHFGLRVSTHFALWELGQCGLEYHKRKINNS